MKIKKTIFGRKKTELELLEDRIENRILWTDNQCRSSLKGIIKALGEINYRLIRLELRAGIKIPKKYLPRKSPDKS